MASFNVEVTKTSEREQAARAKLYRHVAELRESLLDLLAMVDKRPAVSTDIPWPEAERLRRAAREVEHREHKIARARAIIDGTAEAEKLTGPQE
jgi:tRNA nucleotidyltransferase (CCA-adding enzyme)